MWQCLIIGLMMSFLMGCQSAKQTVGQSVGQGASQQSYSQQSVAEREPLIDKAQYYVLEVDRGTVAKAPSNAPVLRIVPLRMTSKFRDKTIVFRTGETDYMPQLGHGFIKKPEQILGQQLKNWLAQSGLFSQVITDEYVGADIILETAVTALYGEARPNFSPAAVLEMQFFFRSPLTKDGEGLLESGLHVSADVAELTPAAVVSAWRKALLKILIALEVNLSDYFQN